MRQNQVLLLCALSVGIFLRAYQFPNLPPGVWADEASAGYETLSLLTTGKDRWGVPLPVYFTEWGAGQNVLYSYLSIPLVAFFGLLPLSTRLVALCAGVLTLPLIYVAVKRVLGEWTALMAMMFLAVLPWHVMISRWGHESNIFPFFLLLGCYSLVRALDEETRWTWKIIAMAMLGASLYAYAVGYLVVPIWLFLIVVFNYRALVKDWRAWLAALILFGMMAFPIALLLIKNFIVHDPLAVEKYLPFGIPLLAFNRGMQVSGPVPDRWIRTFFGILSGFQEGDYRNALVDIAPLLIVAIPLAIVGGAKWIREWRVSRKANIFLLWLIACMPMLAAFNFGVLRFSALYMPLLVAAAYGFVRLSQSLSAQESKFFRAGVVGLIMLQSLVFIYEYFIGAPARLDYQFAFAHDFDLAIRKGAAIADPNEDILVTDSVDLPEMLTAFHLSYPPERYQREEKHHQVGEFYETLNFGRFYFGKAHYPNTNNSFVFVFPQNDKNPCSTPKIFWRSSLWMVGRCESAQVPNSLGSP